MKATARPSPSAITQALVPYPPRERPSASRVSRSADEPPFERHRLLSGGPGCWCRPETSSRAGHHAPGPGAAAAPTRPGAPSGGRSAPPANRDQAQPGWRATWPRSDAARRWPTACAAGPEAGSCPWAGIPRSAAPASSSVRLSAWPLLPSQEEQNARKPIQFKREQALGIAPASARRLVNRRRWLKVRGNDGRALVQVPDEFLLSHEPGPRDGLKDSPEDSLRDGPKDGLRDGPLGPRTETEPSQRLSKAQTELV